jgi:hypothetical protein
VWIGLAALMLILLGVLTALFAPHHCPVTKAAYDRIEIGTTVAEVEKVLGGPSGDYRTIPEPGRIICVDSVSQLDAKTRNLVMFGLNARAMKLESRRWEGNEGDAHVCFDSSGRVVKTLFWEREAQVIGRAELARHRLRTVSSRLFSWVDKEAGDPDQWRGPP